MKLNEDQLRKLYDKIRSIICDNCSKDRTESLFAILDKIELNYITAPASSYKKHHGAYPGGLMLHSLNVYTVMKKLNKELMETPYGDNEIVTVSFFHDITKAGNPSEEYYLPCESEWHRNNLGKMYIINGQLNYLPHSMNSAYVLMSADIQLSKEEFQAIIYHDYFYEMIGNIHNEPKMKEYPLTTMLIFADRWSILRMKKTDKFDEIWEYYKNVK